MLKYGYNICKESDNVNKQDRYIEVKNFIESKGNKLISTEYKNNKVNLKIQCKCGEIFNRTFGDFKNKKMYYIK